MTRPSRRAVLRGIAGAALALPALEIMGWRRGARAQDVPIPSRYLVCFGGMSTGRKWRDADDDTVDLLVPAATGPGYDLPLALEPLAAHAVHGDVSVVSGLTLPWAASDVPAAHRYVNFHNFCFGPLLTGTRNGPEAVVRGTSSEHLVAAAIGSGNRVPAMVYRVQASSAGNGFQSTMSFRGGVDGGAATPVTPKVSPRLIWDELFSGATGGDPESDAAAELLRRRRLSVLDLVRDSGDRLRARLGAADRQRLDEHLQAVRELELRVDGFGGSWEPGAGCSVPPGPGPDPAIGDGYSDEETRASILVDLVHMAFACDLSRAGSLMFTTAQSGLDMTALTGEPRSLHDISHSPDPGIPGDRVTAMARALAWHVGHFARLVRKLGDTIEVDGSRLLDHCALALVFEGGHGFDPQTTSDDSVHSTENMAALVAGGAGGLRQGVHVATAAAHPAAVVHTAMRAVGVPGGFNEVSQVVDALLP